MKRDYFAEGSRDIEIIEPNKEQMEILKKIVEQNAKIIEAFTSLPVHITEYREHE